MSFIKDICPLEFICIYKLDPVVDFGIKIIQLIRLIYFKIPSKK